MYVVVQHKILDRAIAVERGKALIAGTGAPDGARALQFYPRVDGSAVTCLWESRSVDDVQRYVDEAMGTSSINTCYEVDAEQAFADRPLGMRLAPRAA
jgi:hypothetical protein